MRNDWVIYRMSKQTLTFGNSGQGIEMVSINPYGSDDEDDQSTNPNGTSEFTSWADRTQEPKKTVNLESVLKEEEENQLAEQKMEEEEEMRYEQARQSRVDPYERPNFRSQGDYNSRYRNEFYVGAEEARPEPREPQWRSPEVREPVEFTFGTRMAPQQRPAPPLQRSESSPTESRYIPPSLRKEAPKDVPREAPVPRNAWFGKRNQMPASRQTQNAPKPQEFRPTYIH